MKAKTNRKVKRGGADVHLTYFDKKFICTPEDNSTDDTVTSDTNDVTQNTVQNLKNLVENNTNILDTESTSEPTTIDTVNTEETTSDVISGGGRRKKRVEKKKKDIKKKKVNKGKKGGQSCGILKQAGGVKKKDAKKRKTTVKKTDVKKTDVKKRTRKGLYKEFLDKKYSKEQLMKICKKLGIKITVRKNGNVKPIKKETLIKKIATIKFNK